MRPSKLRFLDLIGRIFLATAFIIPIPLKILRYPLFLKSLIAHGIPPNLAPFLLISAIFCMTVGSTLLIFGSQQKLGSFFLLLFLIPTTIIFHLSPFQYNIFFTNLGLIGGLIIIISRPNPLIHRIPIIKFDKIINDIISKIKTLIS
ncbi:DoxX family protein [Prochlorococcus marinus]|uniref:DoxX family protein n=1 Tax=Prochlorococcus marinus TaxID=1219 RepID=UPI0022B505EA|nr:DoxX family protein [Prochlorococcus marinus]